MYAPPLSLSLSLSASKVRNVLGVSYVSVKLASRLEHVHYCQYFP